MRANQPVKRVGLHLPMIRGSEDWLQGQVGPVYDALKADPSRAVTADKLRQSLIIEHKAIVAKRDAAK